LISNRHDQYIKQEFAPFHLLWLLLSPNDLSIGVLCAILGDTIKRKRGDLFQTNQSHISELSLFALGEQLIVDLTTTEYKFLFETREREKEQ
jgi:hypothetical protein